MDYLLHYSCTTHSPAPDAFGCAYVAHTFWFVLRFLHLPHRVTGCYVTHTTTFCGCYSARLPLYVAGWLLRSAAVTRFTFCYTHTGYVGSPRTAHFTFLLHLLRWIRSTVDCVGYGYHRVLAAHPHCCAFYCTAVTDSFYRLVTFTRLTLPWC